MLQLPSEEMEGHTPQIACSDLPERFGDNYMARLKGLSSRGWMGTCLCVRNFGANGSWEAALRHEMQGYNLLGVAGK